jgi:hypothetical protein
MQPNADRDVATASKVVNAITKRDLREVRHLDNWVSSLLRKEIDALEGNQPGDIEDLSRKVREACLAEVAAGRIQAEDLTERAIAALNDLPVSQAIDVRSPLLEVRLEVRSPLLWSALLRVLRYSPWGPRHA